MGPTLPTLLTGDALEGELHRITFRYTDISQSRRALARAAWALNRNGIIRLTGVVSPNLVLALNHEINDLLKSLKIYQTSGILPDNIANTYLNTQEKLMLAGYKKLVNADKAVINTRFSRPDGRSGSDAGMIDIFHPEKLSSKIDKTIQNCTQITLIRKLISLSTLNKVQAKCHNLYINEGVQDTRGFHCDGRALKFKSFVFLTDVKELEDGPYCYVKGTHRNSSAWDLTCKFNAITILILANLHSSARIMLWQCSQLLETWSSRLKAVPIVVILKGQTGIAEFLSQCTLPKNINHANNIKLLKIIMSDI